MARRGGGNAVHHGALFTLSDSGESLDMTPGSTFTSSSLIDINRKIRHSPAVMRTLEHYAREILKQVGEDDFEIIVSHAKSRPRFLIAPKTSAGIHAELSRSVLTMAALSVGHRGRR